MTETTPELKTTSPLLWLARLSLVVTVMLLLMAMHWFNPNQYYTQAILGWRYFFAALIASVPLMLYFYLTPRPPDSRVYALLQTERGGMNSNDSPVPELRPIRWHMLLVAVTGSLVLTQANSVDPHMGLFSQHLQMLLLAAICILAVMALSGVTLNAAVVQQFLEKPRLRERLEQRLRWLWQRQDAKALLVIVTIAAAIRLYNLEYGIHRLIDEINFIEPVPRLWHEGNKPILLPFNGTTAFTWVFAYFQSIFTGIFGAGLSPLRVVAVIFGTAQVVALYALVKESFDRRSGLIAALLMATFPAHVHFSRIGINNIADPLFGLLAMLFLVRGMKTGSQANFAIAGVCLGLTHYFYEGGRLVYTPFIFIWLAWLLLFLRRSEYRFPSLRNGLIFAAALLMVMLPVYYAWSVNELPLTPRFNTVGGNASRWFTDVLSAPSLPAGLWLKLEPPLMFYVHLREGSSFYTGGKLLLMETVPFALFGTIVCIWQLRKPGGSLLFLWMLAVAGGISFLGGNLLMPQSPRYVAVLPALTAVTGIGISGFWERFAAVFRLSDSSAGNPTPDPSPQSREGRLWRGIPYAVAVALAVIQSVYFLVDFLPNYYRRQFYYETVDTIPVLDFDDFLFRVVALPRGTDVYVVTPAVRGGAGFMAFFKFYGRYESGDLRIIYAKPEEFGETFLISLLNYGRNQAFFIEPDNEAAADLIQAFFPDAAGPQGSPFPIPPERQFTLYTYPADPESDPPENAEKKQ